MSCHVLGGCTTLNTHLHNHQPPTPTLVPRQHPKFRGSMESLQQAIADTCTMVDAKLARGEGPQGMEAGMSGCTMCMVEVL